MKKVKKDLRKEHLEPGEIIPLSFDYVFTGIFNDINNIDIVESFLECYFEKTLGYFKGKVTILKRELPLNSKKEKNKQVDLLVNFDGTLINIELNNSMKKPKIVDRNVVFACSIHATQLKYGDNDYSNIGPTIQINLNNDFPQERLKSIYYLINEDGEILTDKLQIHMLDMALGKKLWYDTSSKYYKLACWCKAFNARTISEFKEALGDEIMSKTTKDKLINEVDKYSNDLEVFQLYTKLTKEEMERNTFNKDLKDRSDALDKRTKELNKKFKEIDEKENALGEKENKLDEKENALGEKEKALTNKETTLANKETTLANKETTLANKEIKLANKESTLDERENTLEDRENLLDYREKSLDKKMQELIQKEKELQKKEQILEANFINN